MALDPRIPLGIQPVQVQSPLEMLSQVAQLQGLREQSEARRLAAEETRQKAADAAAIRRVLTETNGDVELALPQLRKINPKAALEFETEIQQARNQKFQAATNEMQARIKGLEFVGTMAGMARDDATARTVNERLRNFSPEIAQLLPEPNAPYDPARWGQLSDLALSAKDRYEKSQTHLKLFGEGKQAEALGGSLSLAKNAEEWDANIQTFLELGGPKAIAAQFGAYSPENVARAAQLAITPAKRAELAGQAETRQQTAAHQDALEANAAAQLGISRGNLAVAEGNLAQRVKEGGAPGSVKLAAAQQEDIATMLTVQDLSKEVLDLGERIKWRGIGPVAGRTGALGARFGKGGEDPERLRNFIGNIQGTIAKLRGGTAFTAQEQVMLERYTPTTTDSVLQIKAKLKSLEQFITAKRENTLRVASGQYTPRGTTTTPTTPAPGTKQKIGRFEIEER